MIAYPQQRAGKLVVVTAGAAVNACRIVVHHVRIGAGVLDGQEDGTARLSVGRGDLLVRAWKDGLCAEALCGAGEEELILRLTEAPEKAGGGAQGLTEPEIHAPADGPTPWPAPDAAQKERGRARLKEADRQREEKLAGYRRDAEEAGEAVREYIGSQGRQRITLNVDGQEVETTAEELGYHWTNEAVVEEAASAYAGGSLIHQYMMEKELAQNPVDLPLEAGVASSSVAQFVNTRCQDMGTAPQNASITRENGAFVITESAPGRAVDAEATCEALNEALAKGLDEAVRVDAVIQETEPEITTEELASIQDVLGTATTSFSSSGAARSTNVSVGASKINGRLLMPGEILSGYECLQPFTTANGYKGAASYANGQVVDSIGGGVCQVSTTLYNAALGAELEIVERHNHSMIVTYVDPSMDAAIAGTVKDLKIKNNYSTPIYIEGYTENKHVTFTIYGKETRPADRQVKYVSETLGRTSPGDPQLIVDPTLAPGARVRVQSSHTGLRSRLWKVVTQGGVEQERTLLNEDTYNASKWPNKPPG